MNRGVGSTWAVVCTGGALLLAGCSGAISRETEDKASNRPDDLVGVGAKERLVSAGSAVGRRLTRDEYFDSLEVVIGVELNPADFQLPRESRSTRSGFRNDAEVLGTPTVIAKAHKEIARAAVDRMNVSSFLDTHADCQDMQASCYDEFIKSAGLLIFRKPVSTGSLERFRGIFKVVQEEGESFPDGARLAVWAMLQSPQFIYRLENQKDAKPGALQDVSEYELATRLSFLIWHTVPDQTLIDLAAAGDLRRNMATQAKRLLGHERARRAMRHYIEEWLGLDASENDSSNIRNLHEETYRLFERIVWNETGSLMSTFTEKRTQMTGEMATEIYGLSSKGSGFSDYELSDVPERIGFLTHGAVINAHSPITTSTAVDRGIFILRDLLCEPLKLPQDPESLKKIQEETVPDDPREGLSQRERFARQSESPFCATCHGRIDPLGFAFDNFNIFGEFRTEDEYGNSLTGAGEVLLDGKSSSYKDIAEFANVLSKSESVNRCLAQKGLHYAFGRELRGNDQSVIEEVFKIFSADGSSYQSLMTSIATHPDFAVVEGAE